MSALSPNARPEAPAPAAGAEAPPAAPGFADRPWSDVAALPRELWLPALVNSSGRPAPRLAELPAWRAALLAGELPPAEALLGDAEAVAPLRAAFGTLGLPEAARALPAVAEQVLRTALWHLDTLIDRPADQPRDEAIAAMVAAFRAEWDTLGADLADLLGLLKDLGELGELEWDGLAGQLRRRELHEARDLMALMRRQTELAALIARLGRQRPDSSPPQPQPQAESPRRRRGAAVDTRLPGAPGEITGVRPGRDLARMLPAEAAQFGHPLLHRLWRARLAESRLMVWDEAAVWPEPRPGAPEQWVAAAARAAPPPAARGPMLVCVDTSGSMRGAPERVAKAVVLEAARVARREGRGCHVLAFGGAGEVLEHRLGFNAQGLDALLDFIGQSFDGGTDLAQPIRTALQRVQAEGWQQADLLVVSDGEFGCTAATLDALDQARAALGLKVCGLLVGDRETLGLLELCDELHWVRDWRRHHPDPAAQAGGHSPVHSKSLTALYFPNALSERARRGLAAQGGTDEPGSPTRPPLRG